MMQCIMELEHNHTQTPPLLMSATAAQPFLVGEYSQVPLSTVDGRHFVACTDQLDKRLAIVLAVLRIKNSRAASALL